MAVKITKRPLLTVTKLSVPVRGSNNRVMTSTWSVPSELTSTKRNDRATGLEVVWSMGTSKGTPKATLSLGIGSKKSSINLDSMKLGRTKYGRKSFYPFTARKLNSVSISIRAKNGKGKGRVLRQTRKFTIPRKPTLTPLSFNTENGVISTTIETNAGADYQERYDTKYAITVTNPFLNGGNPINTSDNASTSTSFSVNYDARDYMRLSYDQFIKVVASAYARGYAGNSAIATRTEYISFPAQASITGIDVSGRDATSKCTIHIDTNRTTEHPVDKVKLQYAADVTYDDANDIPASEWTDTEIVDNGNCTALSISTGKLIPSRGNHTYVRVVTYHLNEDVLYRYSEAKLVEELETPSTPAASIDIDILEATAGKDGKTAVVLIGWNKDGRDDFTGTELSWSDNEDTWKSTDEPSHHEFTWSDGPFTYGGVSYHDSAKITIKGLSEGVLYYVRARRYLEAEIEQFSDYTERVPVLTSTMPESIVATAERFIAKGNPLTIRWTLAGNGLQKEWKIARVKNGAQDGTIIAEGDGSAGSAQISAERLSELAVNNSLSFVVEASTGSKPVTSEVHTVTIIEQPTLQITGGSYTHEHEEIEREYSGEIVTIENINGESIKSLTTPIEPVQDLHGYDKPWAGGNGKNKLPMNVANLKSLNTGGSWSGNTYTINGVTFTVKTDNGGNVIGITTNGTPTENSTFILYRESGADTITRFGSNTAYILNGNSAGGSSTTWYVRLYQLSPWGVIATHDAQGESGVSFNTSAIGSDKTVYCVIGVDRGVNVSGKTFYPMIRLASKSDATYEPYSNICPISGRTKVDVVVSPTTDAEDGNTYTTALGRTVYGGTLDVVSGVLTVDRAMVTLNGSETWGSSNGTVTACMRVQTRMSVRFKPNTSNASLVGDISSAFVEVTPVQTWDGTVGFSVSTDANPYLHFCQTGQKNMSVEAWKTYLASNPIQVVGLLATPQTYQLTPTEVSLLLGTNNIWADSGDVEVDTVEVTLDENQLHSNNLSLNVASNRLCDLITTIKSQGASGQFPQGVMMQANGDTIHSNVYSPAWRNGIATIAMPTGLDFWDGGRYTVSIVAVDRTTGLRSPETMIDFVVSWANQAVSPVQYSYTLTTDTTVNVDEAYYEKVGNDYVLVIPEGTENPRSEGWYTQNTTSFVTLTVIDERDADGDHTQAVKIALTPPAGSSETDVYDIYRMDIEKPHLIGQGFPLTYTAVDEYAPFGDSDLYYRIAIRTVDGDVEFSDIDYTAECENIRFDWSGGSLELPYGNAIGDSFKKDVDIRHHMNGNTNGYWNQSIERTSSLKSSIIKIVQPRDIERARLLARYPNAVFVRLPNGSAFTADVQVTDLSVKNKAVTAIAFDATEIDLTQEFSLPIPFRLEEE